MNFITARAGQTLRVGFCGTLLVSKSKKFYPERSLQPLSLFIGRRYLRAKRQNNFISFISLVSMAGIALGIAALITVLSVMNGFQKEVRAKILGVTSHIQVMGFDGGLANWRDVIEASKRQPEIAGAAPFVMGQGLLTYSQNVRGIGVRGIDPVLENEVADLGSNMKVGKLADLKPGEYGIVLGSELSRALQVQVGTKLQLVVPQGSVSASWCTATCKWPGPCPPRMRWPPRCWVWRRAIGGPTSTPWHLHLHLRPN